MPIYSCEVPSVDAAAVLCMLWNMFTNIDATFPCEPTSSQFRPKDADLANFSRVPGEFLFETCATMEQLRKLLLTGVPLGFVDRTTLASLKQLPEDTQLHHTAPVRIDRIVLA